MAQSSIKEAIKEYKKHLKGKKSDVVVVTQETFTLPETLSKSNVKNIRKSTGLSQSKFAKVLGVDTVTVQKWENGTRNPNGPARRLMQLIFNHPECLILLLEGSHDKRRRKPQDPKKPKLRA